jgi:serine/threonine protein kinase
LADEKATNDGPGAGFLEDVDTIDALPLADAPTVDGVPRSGGSSPATSGRVAPPEAIGPYRILGILGEGGMGTVYEAEQQQPRRRVALKVIRGGSYVDDRRVTMFRREIETLARLDHPNIGAIYDAGRTEDGQHFFAMELVRGRTLDAWLGARRGPVDAQEVRLRLRLIVSICRAVHYAHQRGVIHRDLKPSNIVVPDREGPGAESELPAVKVLDFGLARITDSDIAAPTLVTEIGTIRGTIPYMSPEQTRGNPGAVDVRSDVYALGIILYEALTGVRPYETESSSLLDAIRIVCEQPPAPLRRAWKGPRAPDADLQTIVGKALEKEPDRRYASAAALAEDLQLYLDSRPILARAPSAAYQLRKFARRNRVLVAGIAATFLALVVGVAASTTFAVREAAQRRAAESARHDLQEVADFQRGMLAGVDARGMGSALGRDLRSRLEKSRRGRGATDAEVAAALGGLDEALAGVNLTDTALGLLDESVLARALEAARTRFAGQPLVAAELLRSIGATYHRLGLFDRAEEPLLSARTTCERLLGPHAATTLDVVQELGTLYLHQGRLAEAEPLLSAVLESRRRTLPPDDDRVLSAMNDLALLYGDAERLEESEALFAEAVKAQVVRHGEEDPYSLTLLHNYAWTLIRLGKHDLAESAATRALAGRRKHLGDEHPETTESINNLAVLYRRMGRFEEAERLYLEDYETSRRLLGDEHPDLLVTMTNLGRLYTVQGKYREAEALLSRAVATSRKVQPQGFFGTGFTLQALGDALVGLERFAEAEAALLEAHAIILAAFGPGAEALRRPDESLAALYEKTGRPAKAEAWRTSLAKEGATP